MTKGEKYPVGSHWFLKKRVGKIPKNQEVVIVGKDNNKKDRKQISDITGKNVVWASVKTFRKKPR